MTNIPVDSSRAVCTAVPSVYQEEAVCVTAVATSHVTTAVMRYSVGVGNSLSSFILDGGGYSILRI